MAETNGGLVAALARCQMAFPPIVKSHTNPAFKGSQYADVADVLAAVRPVLAAEGIVISQYTEIDAETGAVMLITTLMYSLNEGMSSRFPLHIAGLNAQGVGSLMTYHRRYQLCALLGVHPVGDDDDGNLAAASQPAAPRQSSTVTSTRLPETGATLVPEKPIAAMTVAELIAFARENGVTVSGSKSDMIRTLQPLVNAATGEEPFGLDAPAVTPVDPETRPLEPVVAQ